MNKFDCGIKNKYCPFDLFLINEMEGRAFRAIQANDIKSLEELLNYDPNVFFRLPNITKKSVSSLVWALQRRGYKLDWGVEPKPKSGILNINNSSIQIGSGIGRIGFVTFNDLMEMDIPKFGTTYSSKRKAVKRWSAFKAVPGHKPGQILYFIYAWVEGIPVAIQNSWLNVSDREPLTEEAIHPFLEADLTGMIAELRGKLFQLYYSEEFKMESHIPYYLVGDKLTQIERYINKSQ